MNLLIAKFPCQQVAGIGLTDMLSVERLWYHSTVLVQTPPEKYL